MTGHAYEKLTPDAVINAVESLGLLSDARIIALNSYENRVYQVGIDDATPIIAKFYRPERWSNEQILEEHAFTMELQAAEIACVPPMQIDGKTLHDYEGFRFSIFERRGGHAPELDNLDDLYNLGSFIGRIHQVGKQRAFSHRIQLNLEQWVQHNSEYLLQHFVPSELRTVYQSIIRDLLPLIQEGWKSLNSQPVIRLHGDCHPGNILYRDEIAHFVDFDDCINGPAIQDLWMLLSGDYSQRCQQLAEIAEGYNEFNDFPIQQISAIETLRTMRLIHYAGWLAKRWDDPAFPMHFPWFNQPRYWSDHILELREQINALQNEPLKLF
jgi:Ser/Thr protein kinase RdoA (MazF antagonist)